MDPEYPFVHPQYNLLELFLKAVGVTSEEIIKQAVFDFDKFINLCLDYKILLNVE